MFSKIKKTVFTTQFYVFILLGGSILFSACQEQDSTQPQLEEVQYEMYDDVFVTVVLDPNKVHEFHSFASLEEHDNYLLAMEEGGEKVIVNKKMYEDLSHYFDPYILSVMDMNYEIEVAGERFKADREAIYKKVSERGEWELYVYYGLTGKVDLRETGMVFDNIEKLETLEDYNFKSPAAHEVYLEKLEFMSNPEGRVAADPDQDFWVVEDYPNHQKDFKYRKIDGGDTLFHSNIRIYSWNKKYTSWGKKAKGGTKIQIRRLTGGDYMSGFETLSQNGPQTIGDFHEDGSADNSVPYVYVRLFAKSSGAGSSIADRHNWWVEKDNADRNRNLVISHHKAEVRENNTSGNAPRFNCYQENDLWSQSDGVLILN
ncbi:MAG: hypothetical protein ABJG41_16765 [Cyclobacteriaceae bacterium]